MASNENKMNGNAHDASENVDQTSVESVPATNEEAQPEPEVTKRSIRVKTWRSVQDNKCTTFPGTVFNRIPNYIGAEKAAELLAATDFFKNAQNIKVDIDRSQDEVKLQVLNAAKNLYISTGRTSTALFAKVNCAADADIEVKKKAILVQHLVEYGCEIDLNDKVELDLLVFGSVAVSRTGHRIGRGNGYVDLDFGILQHCGAITDKTIIVTAVHDEQVFDTLPTELFTNYDVPVDIIVTPTQVIQVSKRLPRPAGIQWHLLSSRRLAILPVLPLIRAREEAAGKIIVLKEEDTDVETNRKHRLNRKFTRKPKSRTTTENNGDATEESPHNRKGYNRNRRAAKNPEDLDSANEKKTPRKQRIEDEEESTEVTKRSLRVQTWRKVSDKRCAAYPYFIFNRVPNFNGAFKAADLLAEIDEYKNAKKIKVNSDKAQDPVKIKVLTDSKELYVAPARDSNAIYAKINCPADAHVEVMKKAIRSIYLDEFGTNIDLTEKVELDMLVIGAVAVSKAGHRLGRGNGFVDLDFGVLAQAGSITDKTIIVATVHDEQVYDTLPEELFTKYDVPVDIIVTPTEVIRVEKRLPRPNGIYWEILSGRRLNIMPVLNVIKANEENTGKIIVLKEEDTDVDSVRKSIPRKQKNGRRLRRRGRSTSPHTDTVEGETAENDESGRPRRNARKTNKKAKVVSNADGDQSASERRNGHPRKRRENRDFCIKVSNIPKNIRIKEFKTELRERGCNPLFISWKGSYGMCYLHFGKQGGDGEGEREAAINTMIHSLDDLSLNAKSAEAVGEGDDSKLKIELVKNIQENRVETVEVSVV